MSAGAEAHSGAQASPFVNPLEPSGLQLYLKTLADALPDALIGVDSQYRVVAWNTAAQALYGWQAQEALGKNLDELIHTTYAAGSQAEAERRVAASGRWSGEVTQLHKDGTRLAIWSSVALVRDESGQAVGLIGINRDDTQRKREEEELRARHANLAALLENTDARVWSVDQQYRLILGNSYFQAQVAAVLGRALHVGESVLSERFPPEVNAQWKSYYDRGLRGETFNIEISTAFSRPVRHSEYRFHPIRAQDGQVLGVTIYERDITDRKLVENALRESEQKIRLLVETAQSGIQELDLDGTIVYANAGYHRIYGCADGEMIGRSIFEIETSAEDALRLRETWRQITTAEMLPQPYESRAVRKDGQEIYLYVVWGYKRDASGQVNGFIANIVDISERRRLEQQREGLLAELTRSQAQLQALSERLIEAQESERRSIAHELHDEIGQELTGLNILLEVLQRAAPEKSAARLGQAQETVQQLMRRVGDLSLNLRPPILDDFGLLPALFWFFEQCQARMGLHVDFESSGLQGRRFAASVETSVYRLVQESLTNVARHAGAAEAKVRVLAKNQRLEIIIKDQGTGFDLAAALAGGRAGGLNGMHERLRLLNGSLSIDTRPGGGTKVSASLPAAPLQAAGEPK